MGILLEFNSFTDLLFNRKYLKIRSLSFELLNKMLTLNHQINICIY